MPYYDFICDDNHKTEKFYSISEVPDEIMCGCGVIAYRSLSGLKLYTRIIGGGTNGGQKMQQKGSNE